MECERTIERTCSCEKPCNGVASQSMPDMRREQAAKELESDARGTSLGEVLSCRIFDPGKVRNVRDPGGSDELRDRCLENRTGGPKSRSMPIWRKSPMMPRVPKLERIKADPAAVGMARSKIMASESDY